MDRGELDALDRESLVARAEQLGIARARILTRPELVDEILVAGGAGGAPDDEGAEDLTDLPAVRAARGFFGRARDLLARVVERGLHLPDAADRIRRMTPPPPRRPEPPLPTLTLAEIYAAQGHTGRALETLRRVLAVEPEHAAARALLARLEADPPAPPAMLPEDEERPEGPAEAADPSGAAAPAPHRPAAEPEGAAAAAPADLGDVCVALPYGAEALFVLWNVATAAGPFVLRFVVLRPAWGGPHVEVRDLVVAGTGGEAVVDAIPTDAVVRVALGTGEGRAFVPLAHSPALDLRGGVPHRWTPEGTRAVDPSDPDAAAIAHARARRGATP